MRKIQNTLAALFLGMMLFTPITATACPLCKEAIAASDDDGEVNNLPTAMNQSIYLMVSVPYLLLGFAGFFIWRGVRQNAAYAEAMKARIEGEPQA
jgi:hypothetical protein